MRGRCAVGFSLMRFLAIFLGLVAALASATHLQAQVVAASRDALAVRGEPMLVEVRVGTDATLPSLAITTGSGVRVPVSGRLLWPYVPAPTRGSLMRWAAPSNPLRISDERPRGADSAYLAVDIPSDIAPDSPAGGGGRAQLLIGASTVSLSLWDAAPADFVAQLGARASMIFPQGERDASLSLPDPDAPFERFRAELGVAMRAWTEPPAFPVGSGSAVAAQAHAALWRAALARVFASSSGPAVELAELLVATCADSTAPAPIAAWIAHPEEMRAVLRLALDRDFSNVRLAASMNEFLRVRSPVLWWIEDSDRTSITLAFANPTTRPQVVRYQWVAGTDTDVLPLVLDVPAAEVRRARVARPVEAPRAGLSTDAPSAVPQLRVQCGDFAGNVIAPPAVIPVSPRGIDLAECLAPLNLLGVSVGARTQSLVVRGTRVALRERLAGWEVYAELADASASGDSITVFGPSGGSIRIDASGAIALQACELAVDAVEFRSADGCSRASFFLPPDWIAREDEGTIVEIGFRRESEEGFVDAPFASVPWRKSPRTVAIDLSGR